MLRDLATIVAESCRTKKTLISALSHFTKTGMVSFLPFSSYIGKSINCSYNEIIMTVQQSGRFQPIAVK